jgi:hypothetical protein
MPARKTSWSTSWAIVLILLVLSLAELFVRGPVRFARSSDFNDFISPYIQTRAWMQGLDPYSPRNLVALWPEGLQRFDFLNKDLADGSLILKRGIPTAYPPTALVLLAPFASLPYRVAHAVWLLTSLLACVGAVFALASVARFRRDEKRTYVFLAIAFALAPFHTGLAAGSIVIVAVGACAVAVWAAARNRDFTAGILLAVATGLKPQIGLPFVLFYFLRRRFRVAGIAVTLVAILAVTSLLFLWMNHVPWLDNYRSDNRILFARGSLGDFTEQNPIRFSLIDLEVLLYTFIPDRSLSTVLAMGLSGAAGILWLLCFRSRDSGENELLAIGALVVLSLLPVYHRLYDASLLIFPLAWSLIAWRGNLKTQARVTFILILCFLIPGGSALERLQHSSYIPQLQQSWFWVHFVLPHQIWVLVLLSATLLVAMRRSRVLEGNRLPSRTPAHDTIALEA